LARDVINRNLFVHLGSAVSLDLFLIIDDGETVVNISSFLRLTVARTYYKVELEIAFPSLVF
jgi:hypothetical protein